MVLCCIQNRSLNRRRNSNANDSGSGVRCYSCNGRGHIVKECPSKKKESDKPNESKEKKTKEAKVMLTSFAVSRKNDSSDWLVDSEASAHMCAHKELLLEVKPSEYNEVIVANNNRLKVECSGNVYMKIKNEAQFDDVLVKDVQYIPDLCANLISVSQLVKKDYVVIFDRNGCRIFNESMDLIATASLCGDMFKLNCVIQKEGLFAGHAKSEDQILWYRRLGHIGNNNLKLLCSGSPEGN